MTKAKTRKIAVFLLTGAAIIGCVAGYYIVSLAKTPARLFKRNAELKAQGYYLAEFEFKMLTVLNHLNEGRYGAALTTLGWIREEMETTRGLVKTPADPSPEPQMAFLLDRQDPVTGAFMDPRYPLFTYISPTLNAIDNLETLARQINRPLKLKYPLRFLDAVNTPETLRVYLDSLLYFKEPLSHITPATPYVAGVSEMAYCDTLEQRGLYAFSREWRDALRKWFQDTQDPETGFWGARLGRPGKWRQHLDYNSTFHVLHLVLDEHGNNRSEQYPLRHADALARNIAQSLAAPIPDDPVAQHDWNLSQSQACKMLALLLWPHLSDSEKDSARAALGNRVALVYRNFFRPADGGFSLYTTAGKADLDGTGTALMFLKSAGNFDGTVEREHLWGDALASVPPLATREIDGIGEVVPGRGIPVNSIRIYRDALPAGEMYDDSTLVGILYPGDATILDVMDLRGRLKRFLESGDQTFGNWQSAERLLGAPLDLRRKVREITVLPQSTTLAPLAGELEDARTFFAVGCDAFQVPVYREQYIVNAN